MHATPPDSPCRRALRLGTAAAVLAGGLGIAAITVAQPAGAATRGAHDPMGSVISVKAVTGGVQMHGWTADPDALSKNVSFTALVDGRGVALHAHTTLPYPKARTKHHTGPTPGFTVRIPVRTGRHIVCLAANNMGSGLSTVLKCVPTPVGTRLSSAATAARSPRGAVTSGWANKASLHFRGWASDPDFISRRARVVLYVDGSSAATVVTNRYPAPRPSGAGYRSRFDVLVPVRAGAHVGCVWVVNSGLGSNRFLGCKTLDTRGVRTSGKVATPALNKKVVAEARKHLGQPYVWGATGPKKFDCSGLVQYSYHKFGFTTPRVSEDQYTAAHLIPASRAVPGDLVFYHDLEGDVYHVGIYTGPATTVAAVDPAEGVRVQRVWDPSITSYGSFTHT